jgi:hypothetical protein
MLEIQMGVNRKKTLNLNGTRRTPTNEIAKSVMYTYSEYHFIVFSHVDGMLISISGGLRKIDAINKEASVIPSGVTVCYCPPSAVFFKGSSLMYTYLCR